MDQSQFSSYMLQSKQLSSPEYYQGYHYGLRRYYHGENFGESEKTEIMQHRGGQIAAGVTDGLEGKRPVIIKGYCTQNDLDASMLLELVKASATDFEDSLQPEENIEDTSITGLEAKWTDE